MQFRTSKLRRVATQAAAHAGAVALVLAGAVAAQAGPLPTGPGMSGAPRSTGRSASPHPVPGSEVHNPFMAQDGRSAMHGDSYASNTQPQGGPLGRHPRATSSSKVTDDPELLLHRPRRRLHRHRPRPVQDARGAGRDAADRLARDVRPRDPHQARPDQPGHRRHPRTAGQQLHRQHRQRGPPDARPGLPAPQPRQRRPPGLLRSRLPARRLRHRELADRLG